MKIFVKKHKILNIIVVSVFIVVITGYFFIDYGFINNSYFVKRDFNNAFIARQVGDCEEFRKYLWDRIPVWMEKCENEKSLNDHPIANYKINMINTRDGKAFLAVELTRLDKTYSVSYEMVKVHNPFPFVVYRLKGKFDK